MSQAAEAFGFIEATLTLRRTEDGGRRSPIVTGYRPNWWLPGEAGHSWVGGSIALIGITQLAHEETGTIRVYPFSPDDWMGTHVGSTVEMCEGPVLIGKATVTRVRLPVLVEAH